MLSGYKNQKNDMGALHEPQSYSLKAKDPTEIICCA